MSPRTLSASDIILADYEQAALQRDLERLRQMGIAISAIATVLEAGLVLREKDPCDHCDDYHRTLTSGSTIGGLHVALDELGDLVFNQADEADSVLRQAQDRGQRI